MTNIVERLLSDRRAASQQIDELTAEIERLREEGTKDYEGMREFQAKYIDASHEIERLRRMLHECLSFALGSPIGWSSDLWERVTKELGDER